MTSRASFVVVALALCAGCIPRRTFPPGEPSPEPVVSARSAAASAGDARDGPAGDDPPSAFDCVRFWPEARFRSYAYDHVVHVGSQCKRVASCTVATNVSPTPVVVAVPPDERVEVVTLRGSEFPEFTPLVQCSRGTR